MKLVISSLFISVVALAVVPSGESRNIDEFSDAFVSWLKAHTVGSVASLKRKNRSVDPAAFVSAHNRWRLRVKVPPLKWSESLARDAQIWADTLKKRDCAMVHSTQRKHGENIFWASATVWSSGKREVQDISAEFVVDDWASETADYRYESNTCVGPMCGHYTQIVWSTTEEVGCAKAICADGGQVWVCRYNPPGNYKGERPY